MDLMVNANDWWFTLFASQEGEIHARTHTHTHTHMHTDVDVIWTRGMQLLWITAINITRHFTTPQNTHTHTHTRALVVKKCLNILPITNIMYISP